MTALGDTLELPAKGRLRQIPLIEVTRPLGGWTFDSGREFPGATGELTLDPTGGRNGGPALILKGDFTQGGRYVQASRTAGGVNLHTLDFWIRYPGADRITIRLVDEGGTCHQLRLRLTPDDGWQRVVFPAAEYFAKMGESSAGRMVLNYEHWGKTRDAGWKGGLVSLHILLSRGLAATPTLWLSDGALAVIEDPPSSATPPMEVRPRILHTIPLDEVLQAGHVDWVFDNGREFPGAKGRLVLLPDQPEPGQNALRLEGDFTGGGAYVQAIRPLNELGAHSLERVVVSLRTTNCPALTVRLVDGTGQCHQRKGVRISTNGQWHALELRPSDIAGGEHWGGANDGRWHEGAKLLALLIPKPAHPSILPTVDIARPRAVVSVGSVTPEATAYEESFEPAQLPQGWDTTGDVRRSGDQPFEGTGFLRLRRTLEEVNLPIWAVGPKFSATPGLWEIALAARSALESPDVSYRGVVYVEWMDSASRPLRRDLVLEVYGTTGWQPVRQTVEAPPLVAGGRFRVELQKTWGTFDVDRISAAPLPSASVAERRVERLMLTPSALGGLFLPGEVPTYQVTLWASKPLRPDELQLTCKVCDFWGAEVGVGPSVVLTNAGFRDRVFHYEGTLRLETPVLEVGKYYRLHAQVPQRGQKPYRHTIGLALLPEAPNRKLPPESVPFTMRNWDNRIREYFFLTDRLGIRIAGVWGGWDLKPPHKPYAPGIGWCRDLGMKWLTGTPASQVERGNAAWADPEVLRQGMRNFLAAFATNGLAYIALGNEPHGGPSQVASNVAAYRVLYETIKAFDPSIQVIATAVEPNEEYFRQGYHHACDIYDFHTYASYPSVREAIRQYRGLMTKYGAIKPIFSTELGLNCQGLSRWIVAQEIVKKFAVFFAAGGANACWFTILYPDPDGTREHSSGQAFNVFDCRYKRYTPKLDAVTLYHAVNGIGDKSFRAEGTYPDGTEAYLFANAAGEAILIAWNETKRSDIGLTLSGITGEATLIFLDGTHRTATPDGATLSLTVSSDPVMVSYRSRSPALPDTLTDPAVALVAPPAGVLKGRPREIPLQGPRLRASEIRVEAPPGWLATCRDAEPGTAVLTVTAPAETEAALGRLIVSRQTGMGPSAHLVMEVPILSDFSAEVVPRFSASEGHPALQIRLANRAAERVTLSWSVALEHEFGIANGTFPLTAPAPARAGFAAPPEGLVNLDGQSRESLIVPLRDLDPQTLYQVRLRIRDDRGRETAVRRLVGGFARVRRGTPMVDGDLSDPIWAAASGLTIGEARQFFAVHKGAVWRGVEDLSAIVRFAWDDEYLYLAVRVTDDVFVGTRCDDALWNQDGLQFLIDPWRSESEKMGYYDYSLGLGTKGAQMWCHSAASPSVPTGEVRDAPVAVRRGPKGNADYEVAIPWSRLAPFRPGVGANLGLGLIVNDDDGAGRNFMGWFGGVHLKETDMVGDLILTE